MSGIAILHSADGPIGRYENELWGVQAPAAEAPIDGQPSGGGQREPLTLTDIEPATAAIEAEHKRQETVEAQKLRTEERDREEKIKREEKTERENIRHEEKSEAEKVRGEEKQQREKENKEQAPPPPTTIEITVQDAATPAAAAAASPPTVIGSHPQESTPSRQASSRTSGGTGRK